MALSEQLKNQYTLELTTPLLLIEIQVSSIYTIYGIQYFLTPLGLK